jgi:hypothetical protein
MFVCDSVREPPVWVVELVNLVLPGRNVSISDTDETFNQRGSETSFAQQLEEWVYERVANNLSRGRESSNNLVRGVVEREFLDSYFRVAYAMECRFNEAPFGISLVEHLCITCIPNNQSDGYSLSDDEKKIAALLGLGTINAQGNGEDLVFKPRDNLGTVLAAIIEFSGQGYEPTLVPLEQILNKGDR